MALFCFSFLWNRGVPSYNITSILTLLPSLNEWLVLEESHSNDNKNANISLKILKKNFQSNIIKNSRLIFQYRDACSSHDKNCQKQLSIVVAQNSSSKNVIKFTVKYRGVLSLVKFLVRICIFFKNSTPSQMFLRNFSEELFYRILPDESFWLFIFLYYRACNLCKEGLMSVAISHGNISKVTYSFLLFTWLQLDY